MDHTHLVFGYSSSSAAGVGLGSIVLFFRERREVRFVRFGVSPVEVAYYLPLIFLVVGAFAESVK